MKIASSYGFAWICAGALVLNACGDDGDGGGSSGISGGKKLSELTASEKTALCEEFGARYEPISEDLLVPSCVAAGLLAEAAGAGTCEQTRDQCLMAEPEPSEEADCTTAGENMTTCEVTVGEYRACLDALAKQAKDLSKAFTCDSDLQELQNLQQSETPAACKAVQEKCPELIGDVDDEENEEDEQNF